MICDVTESQAEPEVGCLGASARTEFMHHSIELPSLKLQADPSKSKLKRNKNNEFRQESQPVPLSILLWGI